MRNAERLHRFFLAVAASVFLWSAIGPHDYFTWVLEVLPAVVGAVILIATYRRFQFSTLVYFFILLHAVILIIGGHYTYAEVPLFNGLRDELLLDRNPYDRLGHFAQGFVPALIAREILLRQGIVVHRRWLFFLVICISLAISAFYELIEWRMAVATGSAADAFLGTQGDPWDTQWDMAMALMGSLCAQLILKGRQDRAIAVLNRQEKRRSS